MRPEEHDLFVRHPDAVTLIVNARREKRPLRDLVSEDMLAVAHHIERAGRHVENVSPLA
jgi:hypothetical protein